MAMVAMASLRFIYRPARTFDRDLSMSKVSDVLTDAQTPTGQDVNLTDPFSIGKMVAGTFALLGAIALGTRGFEGLKNLLGTDSFDIPGAGDL